jgi:secondary thiamine-phosphate synthase enzyme
MRENSSGLGAVSFTVLVNGAGFRPLKLRLPKNDSRVGVLGRPAQFLGYDCRLKMKPGTERGGKQTGIGEFSVRTERRTQLLDVTAGVAQLVRDSGVQQGICYLYVPHTTAGVTINENADPDVAFDIAASLERIAPQGADYRHAEGNADAHVKASLVGSSATVFVSGGQLELGRWQGIFFCEFDGPRTRTLRVKVVPD